MWILGSTPLGGTSTPSFLFSFSLSGSSVLTGGFCSGAGLCASGAFGGDVCAELNDAVVSIAAPASMAVNMEWIGLRMCLALRNNAAGNAPFAAAVLWMIGVIVAAFMDHERAPAYVCERQMRSRDDDVDALVCRGEERQVSFVSLTGRALVALRRCRIIVWTSCEACLELSVLGLGRAIAGGVHMEAVLARRDACQIDLELKSAAGLLGDHNRTDLVADAVGSDLVDIDADVGGISRRRQSDTKTASRNNT